MRWPLILGFAPILAPFPALALINPIPIIIHDESNGDPTAHSPNSTASGLFQDTNSTWAQALALCGCGSITQYPSAYLAPASLQVAANDALINAVGLSPWLCAGCDPAFAAYVAAHGGIDAFQIDGFDINSADFASLDTPAGLAAWLAAQGGDGGGGGGGGGGTGPTPAAVSPSALSFEWVYDQVINGIMGTIDGSIATVEGLASGPMTAILALAIAIMGMMTLIGNMDMAFFLAFALRAAVAIAFVGVGNTFYSQWVEGFVLGIPAYFAAAFSTTSSGASPAQLFDQILNGWSASVLTTWHSAGWGFHAIYVGLMLALLTIIVVLPVLAAMFTVFLISTFLLLVMLTIGPLMALALLFQVTRRFFHGYVNVLVTGAIFALVVDIVLGIFGNILIGIAGNFAPSDSPNTDLPGLFGLAGVLLVAGFSMARLPRLVEAIGGGVSVSMDSVGRFMAGGALAEAAGAGMAVARRVL